MKKALQPDDPEQSGRNLKQIEPTLSLSSVTEIFTLSSTFSYNFLLEWRQQQKPQSLCEALQNHCANSPAFLKVNNRG